MQRSRWLPAVITCAVIVLCLFPILAYGCTIVFKTVHVGTTFRARVSDRGRPVSGLRLVLTPGSDTPSPDAGGAVYSRTDKHGYAIFTNLAIGSYFLASDHDGEYSDGLQVEVSRGRAAGATVQLTWPIIPPLRVRSVAGTLRLADFYPNQTQPLLALSLVESMSERQVATTQTDSKGGFSIETPINPGIYFLQLSEVSSDQSDGAIILEVDPKAKESGLDLNLGWTMCGLHYSMRRQFPEMTERKLCGDVTDSLDELLAGANVWLLSNDENVQILEQTKTDSKGQFVLQEEAEGDYKLLVKRPGFQPFIRVVHLEAADTSDQCSSPIKVQLGPN